MMSCLIMTRLLDWYRLFWKAMFEYGVSYYINLHHRLIIRCDTMSLIERRSWLQPLHVMVIDLYEVTDLVHQTVSFLSESRMHPFKIDKLMLRLFPSLHQQV